MDQKERRLQERYFLQIQAKLSTIAENGEEKVFEETTATNISSSGAFISTTLDIPLASKVFLEFLVNYEQLKKLRFILSADSLKMLAASKIWVKATGVVIRSEKDGIGIIFDQDYRLSPMDANGEN